MKPISFLAVLIFFFSASLFAQELPKPQVNPDFNFISTDGLSELKGHTSQPIPNQYIVLLNATAGIKTALETYENSKFSNRDEQSKSGQEVEGNAQSKIIAIAQSSPLEAPFLANLYI